MPIRCRVFRGFVREAEEDINKFLATHEVRVLHMAQSETGDHVTVTLVFEEADFLREEGR
jgi:hypothetical protein